MMSLTDQEYDQYLSTLGEVEGEAGLRTEAERQRALCDDLARQLHEAEARAKKDELHREYRRKKTVLVELLADLEEQELHALRRQAKILKDQMKIHPDMRYYCPCDHYCEWVHRAEEERNPF